MENFKEQYAKAKSEKNMNIKELNELKNNEKVKKYLESLNKQKILEDKCKNLYKKMKFEEYSSCNHILVKISHDFDDIEGRSYDYYGCIKCGLNDAFEKMQYPNNWLPFEQRVMSDFIKENTLAGIRGKYVQELCDLDLAQELYNNIKKEFPDLDEEKTIECFEKALDENRKKEEIKKIKKI